MWIDLNCDMGEAFGIYRLGDDAELMRYITSANVACGFHAGDPVIMRRTVLLAKQYEVRVGAHPSFPDLQGFGRRVIELSPSETKDCVLYQVGALLAFAKAAGVQLQHVKPHGALYNVAARDPEVARAVAEAVAEAGDHLVLVGLYGSELIEAGKKVGLRVAQEAFADRAYNEDGTLVSRRLPGSVIHDAEEVAGRVLQLVAGRTVAITGKEILLRPDTICLHGDTPGAGGLAKLIRARLEEAGIKPTPMGEFLET
ncbi:MAG: LamB/YcsF family protein [candidate division NC10 bacterium]|nr:LamB/YcsF family protein [candidate division NC10 bacterium]